MDMKKIIQEIRPGAHCVGRSPITKEKWGQWLWDDERPKPTWEELTICWDEIKDNVLAEKERERKIQEEMTTLLRDMAIESLQEKGELTP